MRHYATSHRLCAPTVASGRATRRQSQNPHAQTEGVAGVDAPEERSLGCERSDRGAATQAKPGPRALPEGVAGVDAPEERSLGCERSDRGAAT
jgi:hypothetical protein